MSIWYRSIDNYQKHEEVTIHAKEIEFYYHLEEWRLLCKQNDSNVDDIFETINDAVKILLEECLDTLHARELAIQNVECIGKRHNKESEIYARSLDLLNSTYSVNNPDAIPWLEEEFAVDLKVYGINDIYTIATASTLSLTYTRNHKINEALRVDSIMAFSGDPKKLQHWADNLRNYGYYRKAYDIYDKCMEIYCDSTRHIKNEPGTNFRFALSDAIRCLDELKDDKELLLFGRKWTNYVNLSCDWQVTIFREIYGYAKSYVPKNKDVLTFVEEFNRTHGQLISNEELVDIQLSTMFFEHKYSDMLQLIERELQVVRDQRAVFDTDSLLKAELKCCLEKEICYMLMWNIEKASIQNWENIAMFRKFPQDDLLSKEFISLCARRCLYLYDMKNYDDIGGLVDYLLLADTTNLPLKQILPTHIKTNALSFYIQGFDVNYVIDNILCYLYATDQFTKAKSLITRKVDKTASLFQYSLEDLDYSGSYAESSFNMLNSIAMWVPSDTTLAKDAYNYALLNKQAVMGSWVRMKQQILESGNDYAKDKLSETERLQDRIQRLKILGGDTEKLEEQLLTLKKQIVDDSKSYGDFTKFLKTTWNDIRDALDENSVAVEFLTYKSLVDDSLCIGAAVLTKWMDVPTIVPLCREDTININNAYLHQELCRIIWEPILATLKNENNIYFAATGLLHNISIENLPYKDGLISDTYRLSRLSSTRELLPRNRIMGRDNYIFGGIDYNASANEDEIPASNERGYNAATHLSRDRSASIRAAVEELPYLPGTKTEAKSIIKLLKTKRNITKGFIGNKATEASIKALQPNETKLLHIATHGFYESVKNNSKEQEDDALSRSGLFMAGAQAFLDGEEIPEGVDDGILTAQEISTLDLRGLDLVTLSACETGLGDVTSDGVFGLQRGFKKAGANSILMSLWKVDDKATCKLMTEFYSNWIGKKMTKHDALEAAKKTIRETKGWEDPKYWAAFILLDGLD